MRTLTQTATAPQPSSNPHHAKRESISLLRQSMGGDTTVERAKSAVAAAIGQKAYDVRALTVGSVSDVADYFIIASGTSDRHVKGIADKIKNALRADGDSPLSVSGYETAEWIILDYGDVVVHVFYEPARQYYDFDRLWGHAPQMQLPPELETQVKRLRTGMVQTA